MTRNAPLNLNLSSHLFKGESITEVEMLSKWLLVISLLDIDMNPEQK